MTPFSAFQEMLTALSHYQWRIEAALLIVAFDLIVMGAIWVGRRILWRARLCLDRWSAQKYSGRRRGFVPAVAFTAFHILIFIAVLAMLGVPLSVLGALLSAGIALGIFSDAYVGTTFLLRLPYRVGDFIEYREQGIKGLVSAINISTTVLIQADGSNAVIPNRKLADTIVFNYTQYDQHRLCYMLIIDQGVAYFDN